MQVLALIIPGLVAIVGNLIFYWVVKTRMDESIERYKISYSGIFKEKIEIHREILKQLIQLQLKIERYQISGIKEMGEELFSDFNNFILYYSYNQPFLDKKILVLLNELRLEFQNCFDSAYAYNSWKSGRTTTHEHHQEAFAKFGESINKFRSHEPIGKLRDLIISEMRKDLRTDESNNPNAFRSKKV